MSGLRNLLFLLSMAVASGGHTASVSLQWTASAGGDVAGYYVHVGNASRSYWARLNVGNQTAFNVIGLPGSSVYYFSVTAYNAARVESDYSNEVSVLIGPVASDAGMEIVEYYEPGLDHFFITASRGEQAFVESGAVGNWRRTGQSFKAGGPVPVCRFYGNSAPDPVTGAPYGPNSHFYTADADACVFLNVLYSRYSKSWRFESFDFSTTRPAEGTCPINLVPVYRAYNNGLARGIDSNHRFTTSRASIEEVVARGWLDEGIVFCTPP